MLYVFITNQVKYTMAQSLDLNHLEKLYGILAILQCRFVRWHRLFAQCQKIKISANLAGKDFGSIS